MIKALLIDDDLKLAELLENYLKKSDIKIDAISDPLDTLQAIRKHNPEVIVLDVMMPKMDGFEVCQQIRKDYSLPIIMLSARGEPNDKIRGLESGADDYLAKPFEPRELVARIMSLIRRIPTKTKGKDSIFEIDDLHLEIKMNGSILDLTTKEYDLLSMFINNPGITFTRDEIIKEIKGIEAHLFSRSIDILISRLRQKIESDPKSPKIIKTIWGKGYLFLDVEK
jgi:DNA-binding response OmpR family regulator|tara:strand:+ start:591 stop:1265 length:675 start_codon:yes stop_codon:yes gene_type:complete